MNGDASPRVPDAPWEGDLPWLRRLAHRLVQDEHEADDLAQDACVAALEALSVRGSPTRAWWRTVVARRAARRRVRERSRVERERLVGSLAESPPADRARERLEIQRRVVDALSALDERHRTVLYLRFYEDLPPRRIARVLDLNVATVKQRLHRGLARLRARLDGVHGGRDAWLPALLPLAGVRSSGSWITWNGVLLMNAKLAVGFALILLTGLLVVLSSPFDGTANSPLVEESRSGEREEPRSVVPPPSEGTASRFLESSPSEMPEKDSAGSSRGTEGKVLARLDLRVVDRGGDPVPGAMVDVFVDERANELVRDEGQVPNARPDRTLTLDAHGATREVALPTRFLLRPRGPGFVALETLYGFGVRSGELGEHVLRMAPASVLAGSVRDAEGNAIQGAELEISWRDAALYARPTKIENLEVRAVRGSRATTGEDGTFALERPADETHDLNVQAHGYRPFHRSIQPSDREVHLVLERLQEDDRALRGRVEDSLGRAIEGAEVRFEGQRASTTTDARGLFRIEDPALLEPLVIQRQGYRAARFRFETAWLTEEVRFVLEEGATIAGRVLSAKGDPVPEVLVEARERVGNGHAGVERTRTSEDGRFAFAVRPGTHVLRAVQDGRTLAMRSVHAPHDSVVLVAGEIEPGVSVLHGRVTDGNTGAVLRGATVRVTAAAGGTGIEWNTLARTKTDEEGRYRLEDVAWKSIMIDVTSWGYVAERVQPRLHVLGETELDFALFAERELDVRVLDAGGNPASGVSVRAFDENGQAINLKTSSHSYSLWVHTGPEGRAPLRGLPARKVSLHASPQLFSATDPYVVDLSEPRAEPVVLRLPIHARRLTRSLRLVPKAPPDPAYRGELWLSVLDDEGRPVARFLLERGEGDWTAVGASRTPIDPARGIQVKVPAEGCTLVREGSPWRIEVGAEARQVELDFSRE